MQLNQKFELSIMTNNSNEILLRIKYLRVKADLKGKTTEGKFGNETQQYAKGFSFAQNQTAKALNCFISVFPAEYLKGMADALETI